jgi:hypothetical protein
MDKNIGFTEQKIRIGLGIVLLLVGGLANLPGWGGTVAMALGLVALVSGLIRFCPLWRLLGINTCQVETQEKS